MGLKTKDMKNYKESMVRLNELEDLTKKHIKQMESDYLNHYMVSNGLKVGDIVQSKGGYRFHHSDGFNADRYSIITDVECEFHIETRYWDPNKSEMENRFTIHMYSCDLIDSGVSKKNDYGVLTDYKVICSQDRLKEICEEMGIKYELSRKTLKKITNVTIESL